MDKNEFAAIAIKHASKIAPAYGAKPAEIADYLLALAQVESGLDSDARNKNSTARGVLQMLICTQRECEKKRAKVAFAPAMFSCKVYKTSTVKESDDRVLNDPDYAIMLSCYELCYQYKRYKGNIEKAVHAYNQGSYPGGNINEGGKYTAKVMKNLGKNPDFDYASLTSQQIESTRTFGDTQVTYKEFY